MRRAVFALRNWQSCFCFKITCVFPIQIVTLNFITKSPELGIVIQEQFPPKWNEIFIFWRFVIEKTSITCRLRQNYEFDLFSPMQLVPSKIRFVQICSICFRKEHHWSKIISIIWVELRNSLLTPCTMNDCQLKWNNTKSLFGTF